MTTDTTGALPHASGPPARHVVIVGGSASIGPAIAARFTQQGARVVTTFCAHPPAAGSMTGVSALHLDLRDDASISACVEELGRLVPRVDVVIVLAGLLPGRSLADYTDADVDAVMAVNFSGPAKMLRRMLPLVHASSSILLFSSISAQRGSFDPIYAAAKGAILSFVKSMASKLPPGARINAVAPGLIEESDMFKGMTPDRREVHRAQVPAHRLLVMDDLAAVLVDLCQPHWAHLNGACVDLNGGQHVR